MALVHERTILTDCRLSAKLVPTFADRGVSRSQCGRSPTAVISFSRPEPLFFLSSSFSLVVMRPGTLTIRPQRRSIQNRRRHKYRDMWTYKECSEQIVAKWPGACLVPSASSGQSVCSSDTRREHNSQATKSAQSDDQQPLHMPQSLWNVMKSISWNWRNHILYLILEKLCSVSLYCWKH
jgi:hypothetical protein